MTFAAFMRSMVLVRDDRTGELRPPVLHPEEVRIVEAMDTVDLVTGLRRYLTIIVSWPRKGGKTFMSACMGIYSLVFDTHHTQREVLVQASTKDQGQSACFKAMRRLVKANPWLATRITMTADGMVYVDEAGIEHTVRVLPNSPGAVHGLDGSCVLYDEAWVHPNWEALEGTSPSPARACPLTVWSSYSGLKSQRTQDNPWYSVLSAAMQADDPTVFLSHLSGREQALSIPWITEGWLSRLEKQFAHIRSKFLRLAYNVWSVTDSGAFLAEAEIADAIDRSLPTMITIPSPHSSARIGCDLGLVRDRTAIVATGIAPSGQLVVLHVEIIAGTRQRPVSLMDVEQRILHLARWLQTTHVALDRWQSAQMSEGLRRQGLWAQNITCDAAWLDRAAMNLKRWFSQRHIRIPAHPGLLEELEGLESEELRRRDRVRFTAHGSNHDDACVALCLSAERFAGSLRPEDSQIGLPRLAEIQTCHAADVLDRHDVPCPVAGEVPSLQVGCRRCSMFLGAEQYYAAHLNSGQEWISLGDFVTSRLAPNDWLRDRRITGTLERLGLR
jgi:hypothetical protein